ncbi:hypothetical protein P9139_01155 [Curtobacterium flaccumfaciens]|nr:hypothetical protein P9139_01155 [Curtobacterium flaccumfaciens]
MGVFAALEVGVPAVVALAAGSDLVRIPERGWTRERWHETDADTGTATGSETGAESDGRDGSLLAALDDAGAGRTTDVHRFVVEETHATPAEGDRPEPEPQDPHKVSRTAETTSEPTPARDPDADVELPDWARTDAVASDRVTTRQPAAARGGVGAIRERLRGAADGVRERAGNCATG